MTLPGSAAFSAVTPIQWLMAGGVLGLALLSGFIVRTALFSLLKTWFEKTETKMDDIILDASKFHVLFWFFLIGLHYALLPLHFPDRAVAALHRGLVVAWGISLTLWASKIVGEGVQYFTSRVKGEQAGSSSLIINLCRMAVVIMGGMFILSNLGISIAPLLTALGVGSLAVALALQDTLSNIFAGFYMLISRQIRPGEFVKLDSGQEGAVMDIGWRSTRIREPSNNVVIVPNSKMAQAIITNYDLHQPEMACLIQLGVSYDSDLEKVERIVMEIARDVQKTVSGAVIDFDPFIRYNAFGDSSINFTVILRVRNFVDRALVTHEFIKRAHRRFGQEKIEIPFPQRVVHLNPPATLSR